MNKFEMLSNLLASHFESQLTFLEKNSRNHLSLVSTSIDLARGVTNLCISIGKRIKEKPAPAIKRCNTPLKNNLNRKYNVSKTRPKTPKKGLSTSKSQARLGRTPIIEKKLTTSKSNGNLLKANIKTPQRAMRKYKSTVNLHSKTNDNSTNSSYRTAKTILSKIRTSRPSITSINKKNLSTSLSKQYKNSKRLQGSCSNHSSINNFPKKKDTNNNIKLLLKKGQNKTLDDDSISKILSMESNIQNDFLLNHEDPLLINPITDVDFIHNDLMIKLNDIDGLNENHVNNFSVEEFAEDHLGLITKFLDKRDLCNLLMTNKLMGRLVKCQMLSNLENEKKKYEDKISEFKPEDISAEENGQFKIKKNTLKALTLLNGEVLSNPFKERNRVPSKEVLRIYIVFFQLINHPNAKEIWNKREFWEKCCDFFMVENTGKIGDFIKKNVNEKIVLSIENIYQIIHLIGDNLSTIFPGYFSNICGTTGLFAFIIKDVLDFFGISTDKEIQKKSYWTYKKLVNVIDGKIDKIKNLI